MTDPVVNPAVNPVARAVIALIQLYRQAISPMRPPTCRYTPTCSGYAVEAIQLHGLARGGWLAVRRLGRCHPFHAGGHDPVPPVVATMDPATMDPAAMDPAPVAGRPLRRAA